MKKSNTSVRQRIECFKRNLPGLLKDYADYEKSKVFPNNFTRPKNHA